MYYKHLIVGMLLMIFLSSCTLLDEKYKNTFLETKEFLNTVNLESAYIGMTREQVDYVFGKPIIPDVFHDVYHYVFYQKDRLKKKILSLFFKNNRVCLIEIH